MSLFEISSSYSRQVLSGRFVSERSFCHSSQPLQLPKMIPKQVAALLLCSALGAMAIPQPGQQPPPSTDTESSSSAPDAPICDSKWELIGRELKAHFIDSHGLCTDFARQCIRIPFHDCFPDGGCDGSLILSDECTTRKENRQMIPMCDVLGKIHREYNVGAADLINFAGCECLF